MPALIRPRTGTLSVSERCLGLSERRSVRLRAFDERLTYPLRWRARRWAKAVADLIWK